MKKDQKILNMNSPTILRTSTADLYDAHVLKNYARAPLTLVRGRGSFVWDDQGKQYLDFTSGIAVSALGHCHPHWVVAIQRQAGELIHTSNLFRNPNQGELARRLVGSPVAACVAGLAWALAGYNTSQWTAGLRMDAGAWVPWVAVGHLALLDSLRPGGRGWRMGVVKAALPTAFGLLIGEVFVAMMGVGFALATTVAVAVLERRRDPGRAPFRARGLGLFVLAPALAAGVGAITLLPANALKGSTERAAALSQADAERQSGKAASDNGDWVERRHRGQPFRRAMNR